ncbi:hypothetical protein IAI10_15005 [Clostridium sp. 19966]|uniref:hypothetical protein n=1 Tax=Clostridium sp. 19966 TaxID=2768166 RepID=UPI0028E0756E|nr:hypothetical protein [Clostridium sp. 19966]MDT8717972.1 hypothetical protein [Clostridium sp. 19966]
MEFIDKNYYIIKDKNNCLWRFMFDEKSRILYQIWDNDRWSEKKSVCSSCKRAFYPCISKDEQLQVFYVDNNNSIVLSIYTEGKWNEKVILSGNSNDTNLNILFFKVIFQEQDIHIFYILENSTSKETVLVHQSSIGSVYWNSPKILDIVTSLKAYPFHVCKDSKDNILIFYQNYKAQNYLGYRRFFKSSNMWSEFYVIDKSPSAFLDFSIITKDNFIYAAYIEDQKHYCCLKLRCRENSWNPAITLTEKTKIESCLISIIDNKLWIYWVLDNKLFNIFTDDNGKNFSSISSKDYNEKAEILKASYECSNTVADKSSQVFSEYVYVNMLEDSDLFTLEEFSPDITKDMILQPNTNEAEEYSPNVDLDDIKKQIDDVYKKIYFCKKQLSEKDYQISQLSFALDQKNREASRLEYELQKSIEEKNTYAKEIKIIKNKNTALEEKLKSKDMEISSLRNKTKISEDDKNKLEFKISNLNQQLLQLKNSFDNMENMKKNKKSFLSRLLGNDE